MENLTPSSDPPHPQQQQGGLLGGARPPPQPQNLPPQMFTTAAQLLDLTDKKLMVALRDGRKLIGILRSWDQFANLVLQGAKERIFVPPDCLSEEGKGEEGRAQGQEQQRQPQQPRGLYADIDRGIYLVRGENVLLLGEIDLDKDDEAPLGYDLAEVAVVEALAKKQRAKDRTREKAKLKRLASIGFEGENLGEVSL